MLALKVRLQALPPAWLDRCIQLLLVSFVLFSPVSISLMQASYILAVILWVVSLYLQDGWQQVTLPFILPVGGLILASALGVITSVAPYSSLIEMRSVLDVLIFYLAVNQIGSRERAMTLTSLLIGAGTAVALYGLCQSAMHGTGWRVYGTMSIYMTFAGLLMLIDLIALAHVLYQPRGRSVLWYAAASICITAALIMTHTRSAWVGLIAGGCLLVGLRKRLLILALPLLLLLIFVLLPSVVQQRALHILDRKDVTAQERLSMWRSGWQIWREHPVTGIGVGTMAQTYQRYREPDAPISPTRRLGHLHNNVIQIAAERGILGLGFWLWIWVAYAAYAWQCYRRLAPGDSSARALVVGSLASVVAFHVEGMFENTFGDSEVISLVYFLMALPFVVQQRHASVT